MGCFKIPTINA